MDKGKGKKKWILLCVGVLLTVALAATWQGGGLDRVRRLVNYSGVKTDAQGYAVRYTYVRDKTNHFAQGMDFFAVLSQTELNLWADDGSVLYTGQVQMQKPMLVAGEKTVLAYGIGGEQLLLLHKGEVVLSYAPPEGQSILTANLNENGWLTIVTGETGYKAVVEVYRPNGEAVFTFRSMEHFVLDAVVSEDNRQLIIASPTATSGVFSTQLMCYDLGKTEPDTTVYVSDALLMQLQSQKGWFFALGQEQLFVFDGNGKQRGGYDFQDATLRDWSLTGDGFAALQLGLHKNGSAGTLVTVDENGKALGSLAITEEVLSLSATGNYLAVLYDEELVIYTKELAEYAVCSDPQEARAVLMREDGSVLLVGSEKAWLVLP